MIHRYDIIIYVKLDRYMIDQHISELLISGFKKLDQIRSPSFAKKPRLNDARRSIIQSQDRREVFNESHEFLASSRTQERVSFIGHFMRERQLTFFFTCNPILIEITDDEIFFIEKYINIYCKIYAGYQY